MDAVKESHQDNGWEMIKQHKEKKLREDSVGGI